MKKFDFNLPGLTTTVLDRLPIAVTIADPDGAILYYNPKAAQWLDRKPEYIGRDVRFCHKPESVAKIDDQMEAFKNGRTDDFIYSAERNGIAYTVTISPIIVDSTFLACMQAVVLKNG